MYTFDDTNYKAVHGKVPRGQGLWCFKVGGWELYCYGTLTSAKRQAAYKAKQDGVPTHSRLMVCG